MKRDSFRYTNPSESIFIYSSDNVLACILQLQNFVIRIYKELWSPWNINRMCIMDRLLCITECIFKHWFCLDRIIEWNYKIIITKRDEKHKHIKICLICSYCSFIKYIQTFLIFNLFKLEKLSTSLWLTHQINRPLNSINLWIINEVLISQPNDCRLI